MASLGDCISGTRRVGVNGGERGLLSAWHLVVEKWRLRRCCIKNRPLKYCSNFYAYVMLKRTFGRAGAHRGELLQTVNSFFFAVLDFFRRDRIEGGDPARSARSRASGH
jgi:hypothetical protein